MTRIKVKLFPQTHLFSASSLDVHTLFSGLMDPKLCVLFPNNLSCLLSCDTAVYVWYRGIIADIHTSVERENSWDLKAMARGHSFHSQALWSFIPAADHDLWHIIFTDFQKHFIVLVCDFLIYFTAYMPCVEAPAWFSKWRLLYFADWNDWDLMKIKTPSWSKEKVKLNLNEMHYK